MKYRQKFFQSFVVASLVLMAAFFSSCEGGTCAASVDPLTDADSDCVEDGSDNCDLIYNPDQFDGDEDGIGFACDDDDTDEAVALIIDTNVADTYPSPLAAIAATNSVDADCDYFAVGCGDVYLGLMDGRDREFAKYVIDSLSPFSRDFTSCSAFNPEANFPPAVYCDQNLSKPQFVGFLTLNPNITPAIPTCDFLDSLDIQTERCSGF